jgi:hypothetical protein
MITQEDLRGLINDEPEMIRAYYEAVNAVIEYRKDVAAIQPNQRNTAQLKKKQFAATIKLIQFANGIVFNDQPLSEEDKKLVRHWVVDALA